MTIMNMVGGMSGVNKGVEILSNTTTGGYKYTESSILTNSFNVFFGCYGYGSCVAVPQSDDYYEIRYRDYETQKMEYTNIPFEDAVYYPISSVYNHGDKLYFNCRTKSVSSYYTYIMNLTDKTITCLYTKYAVLLPNKVVTDTGDVYNYDYETDTKGDLITKLLIAPSMGSNEVITGYDDFFMKSSDKWYYVDNQNNTRPCIGGCIMADSSSIVQTTDGIYKGNKQLSNLYTYQPLYADKDGNILCAARTSDDQSFIIINNEITNVDIENTVGSSYVPVTAAFLPFVRIDSSRYYRGTYFYPSKSGSLAVYKGKIIV